MYENMNNLIAVAKNTRKEINQDHCTYVEQVNAVIVADGIGSLDHAGKGSEEVVRRTEELLLQEDMQTTDMQTIFKTVQADLDQIINSFEGEFEAHTFGTTMIVAVETKEKFVIGYIGNGAILHIRGNVTSFKEDIYYLPWACTNYLNPHSEPLGGKEALYKHFGYKNTEEQVTPTIIEITKDNSKYGDILVICTDGIYSKDQLDVTKDEDESIWVEGTQSLQLLLNELQKFLINDNYYKEELQSILDLYLEKLKQMPSQMNDDCALGVICSEQVLKYQKNIKNGNH